MIILVRCERLTRIDRHSDSKGAGIVGVGLLRVRRGHCVGIRIVVVGSEDSRLECSGIVVKVSAE